MSRFVILSLPPSWLQCWSTPSGLTAALSNWYVRRTGLPTGLRVLERNFRRSIIP